MIPTLAFFVSATFTVHLSPAGLDSNLGTSAKPIRTLKRALERVRSDRAGREAIIVMAAGDYKLSETLALTKQDSRLTVKGKGRVRILGGQPLPPGKLVEDASTLGRLSPQARISVRVLDLSSAQLNAGKLRYRGFADGKAASGLELFNDGEPMILARYPNEGEWLKVEGTINSKTFIYPGQRPSTWKSPHEAWVFGYFKFDWCDTYDKAMVLDSAKRTVELSREPDYGIDAKRRFYFFNVLEELDSPGEYFIDRVTNKLYFWPKAVTGDLVGSMLETPLVHIDNATQVQLQGLSLEAGRDGGVLITGGSDNKIQSCLIRNMGVYGVSIRDSKRSGVEGCDLTGLGGRGIELIGGNRSTLESAGLYAIDNHIWKYSRWPRTYQAAIAIEGVGAKVSHNLIEQAPHNAILLAGNDHVIEYNDIKNVCLETGDSGAIYMGHNLTMRGNQIRFNRFRDIVPTVTTEGNFTNVMSVYLDDQWSGTTIFGNVFEGKGTGIQIGGGRDNKVENNVFVGKGPAVHIDQRGKDWAKGKEAEFRKQAEELKVDRPPFSTRYPAIRNLLREDLMLATGNSFVNNIVAGDRPFWFQDGLTEKSLDYRTNVLIPTAPLKQALEQAPRGFKAIPLGKIGLATKGRPSARR